MQNLPSRLLKKVISKVIPEKLREARDEGTGIAGLPSATFKARMDPLSNIGPKYSLSGDKKVTDEVFEAFRQRIYDLIDERRRLQEYGTLDFKIYREHGKIAGNRPYFYIRPFNHLGWLIERQGIGWVISQADKVSVRDMFVRKGDVWDIATVLESEQTKGQVRISSQRLSAEHLPLSVYVERLADKIGLSKSQRTY